MNIRVVDFEILTRHHKTYQEGVYKIEEKKSSFLKSLDPIKNEINSILKSASSGIIMDEASERKRNEMFQKLQQDAFTMEKDFKYEVKKMSDELNITVYENLSSIIKKWAADNSIDLVMGANEVVYLNSQYDVTDFILEILKSMNLYGEELLALD
jgi:Skp family chaperone for outer membrane proteins